ncbi:MAG: ribonuclease III [Spirochaetales bacterium]|nr:ribonuclease III [Spirochaetales bacterium]
MTIISNTRKQQLKTFQKILRINFKNISLLDRAVTHRSYGNEQRIQIGNYERLEFLGDSLLGFITSEYLYRNYPDLDEGRYSQIKAVVVSEDTLSKIAHSLHYGEYILIGKGEERSGGRDRKAILADIFEAVIGAYYLDCQNMSRVRNFVLRFIAAEINLVIESRHEKDYKTLLQEYCQKTYNDCPSYKLLDETGPEHQKRFQVSVSIEGRLLGEGVGASKKEAEKNAAEHAYRKISSSAVETRPVRGRQTDSGEIVLSKNVGHNRPNADKYKGDSASADKSPRKKRSDRQDKSSSDKPARRSRKSRPAEEESDAPKKFYENIDFDAIRRAKKKK